MMKKIIALDIGGVCLKVQFDRAMEKLGLPRDTVVPESLLKSIELLEKGKTGESEWLESMHIETGGKFRDDEIVSAYNLVLGDPMEGMLELIADATSRGFKFVFFSDTSKLHITHFFKYYEVCTVVSSSVFSFEAGARKPEPPMYEAFEKRFGVPCLYLDDKEENIRAGTERGWRSRVFRSAETLRTELEFLSSTHLSTPPKL